MTDGHNLTGNYFVRRLGTSVDGAKRWLPRVRDRAELRRHALKLRYWPSPQPTDQEGRLVDLDWCYIRGLDGLKIGELRIHETIGGHDNLRVIFFVGPPDERYPKTCIWILDVFQKKRDDFTDQQIRNFRNRRAIVLARFYQQ